MKPSLPSFPLWETNAPGALASNPQDIPTLTPFLPQRQDEARSALIIFPGGGYEMLADHEGQGYAEFFSQRGIVCFVLKYRLGSSGYRHPVMLQDAERAMRLVRSKANEYQIDPQKIGVIGSSAGGHLVATLLTHYSEGSSMAIDPIEKRSSRPDLGILCYPVITLGEHTHEGSKRALLGETPSEDLVQSLSNELQVTPQTPPCFLWHTWEDQAVEMENSMLFASALRRSKVPFDLHIYQQGQHGIGLGSNHPWSADALFWLRAQNFLTTTLSERTS
ncbi:MAG: alpha/beta hydrolase [Verrucomicrobiota bacterium]